MGNKTFALFVVAILAVAGAGGAIVLKSQDNKNYEELDQFLEICKVPRVSGYCDQISDYLVQFAEDHDLPYERDSVGNVMIDRPGYVNNGIILQSHMDMVGITEPGYIHDFTRNGLDVIVKDGYVSANHTSLGADDGSGIAVALCALISPELTGYGLRCIFTVDEETDMKGAKAVPDRWLDGYNFLVNIDDELEGEILFGSAGAYEIYVNQEYATTDPEGNVYGFYLHDLLGGHSGIDIDKNRANAILLSMELMKEFTNIQIKSVEGGQAFNAIPDSCYIVFSCDQDEATVKQKCQAKVDEWKSKYADKDMSFEVRKITGSEDLLSVTDSKKLVDDVLSLPNGISRKLGDNVIASSNIGVMVLSNGSMSIDAYSRSAIEELLPAYEQSFVDVFGREHVTLGNYNPAWYGDADSLLCEVAADAYHKVSGKDAAFNITHGALEVAHFAKHPGLQIISIGPTIHDVHSMNERMSVESLHILKETVFEMVKRCS